MRPFFALALNGFREARRNRVSIVVVAFAILLVAASSLATNVTVYTLERVLTDVALGGMSFALVFLAIFLSSGMLAREIERRTIFLVVSKPISRSRFLVARFAGNMLTLGGILLAMAAVFILEVYVSGFDLHLYHLAAISMLWIEVMVLSSIGFALSSRSSQVVSAVITTGLYFAGHLAPDVYTLSAASPWRFLRVVGKAAYYILPNLDRLNLRPLAAYQTIPSLSQYLSALAYGAGYTAVMLVIATLLFAKRDFK